MNSLYQRSSNAAVLQKHDLQFQYRWNVVPPDDPRVTGRPDSTLLNRHEGYEVLPYINRYCWNHGLTTKPEGLKVERMVHACPSALRSHAHVTAWIDGNWRLHR